MNVCNKLSAFGISWFQDLLHQLFLVYLLSFCVFSLQLYKKGILPEALNLGIELKFWDPCHT